MRRGLWQRYTGRAEGSPACALFLSSVCPRLASGTYWRRQTGVQPFHTCLQAAQPGRRCSEASLPSLTHTAPGTRKAAQSQWCNKNRNLMTCCCTESFEQPDFTNQQLQSLQHSGAAAHPQERKTIICHLWKTRRQEVDENRLFSWPKRIILVNLDLWFIIKHLCHMEKIHICKLFDTGPEDSLSRQHHPAATWSPGPSEEDLCYQVNKVDLL